MFREHNDPYSLSNDLALARGRQKQAREGVIYLLCIFLIVGPLWLSLGVGDLEEAVEDSRGKAIEATQEAVEEWNENSKAVASFSSQPLVAHISTPQCGTSACHCFGKNVSLELNKQQTDHYVDDTVAVPQYQQVKFVGFIPETIVTLCPLQVDIVDTHSKRVVATFSTMLKATLEFDLSMTNFQCPEEVNDMYDYKECMEACNSMQGFFINTDSGPRCTLESYIKAVCVKITQDSHGNWVADNEEPSTGTGCYLKPEPLAKIDEQSVRSVQFLNQDWAMQNSVKWPAGFYIYVRSSADPYLAYQEATQGTGFFGLTKVSLISRGVLFTLFGGAMTIGWLLSCVLGWKILIKRRRELTDMRDKNIVIGFPASATELTQFTPAYMAQAQVTSMPAVPVPMMAVPAIIPLGTPMPLQQAMPPPSMGAPVPTYAATVERPESSSADHMSGQAPTPRTRNGYVELNTADLDSCALHSSRN